MYFNIPYLSQISIPHKLSMYLQNSVKWPVFRCFGVLFGTATPINTTDTPGGCFWVSVGVKLKVDKLNGTS